jgi:hypothetical protein
MNCTFFYRMVDSPWSDAKMCAFVLSPTTEEMMKLITVESDKEYRMLTLVGQH